MTTAGLGGGAVVAASLPAARRPGMPSAGVAGVPPRHAAAVLQGRTPFLLPLDPLPATHLIQTFPLSAVALVVAPSLNRRPQSLQRQIRHPSRRPLATHRFRCYAELVPWEVMTPLGPPGEDGLILLGHSALDALSSPSPSGYSPAPLPVEVGSRKTREDRQNAATAQAVTREGNREGDAAEMLWA